MLTTTNTGLLVVDIQGKLARLVEGSDALIANTAKLVAGARLLGLPVVWLEQNPDKLGATVPELQLMQAGDLVLPKHSFGALGNRRWPTPSPVRASATGWCAASRPIFASTRRCRDCWTRAARCRWWWMRCRRAARQPGARHPQAGGTRGRTHLGGDVPLRAAGRLPPSGLSIHSGVDQITLLPDGLSIRSSDVSRHSGADQISSLPTSDFIPQGAIGACGPALTLTLLSISAAPASAVRLLFRTTPPPFVPACPAKR